MPSRTVDVIINPVSGGGRSLRHQDEIRSVLGTHRIEVVLHATKAPGQGREIAARLADDGAETIVAAGGDGSIHDVANGILASARKPAFGVLPLGTGNDFAKVVPGARDLPSALRTLAKPRVVPYDVGHASWQGGAEFFVNGAGTGIDVEVVRQIQRMGPWPATVKYLLGLFRALAVYEPVAITAQLPGESLTRTVMMMALGNGVCQGGAFYLTPHASPRDGRLELCIIDEVPLWKVPLVLPLVMRGTHAGHPAVTMRTLETVRFEAKGQSALFFQLDGELREPPAARWLDISIRKSALNVITAMDRDE